MTACKSIERPAKPKGFPLVPAANGQWCKKFKGKRYYFGRWDDPDAAMDAWERFEASHVLGIDPSADEGKPTIGDIVEAFMDAKEASGMWATYQTERLTSTTAPASGWYRSGASTAWSNRCCPPTSRSCGWRSRRTGVRRRSRPRSCSFGQCSDGPTKLA